MQIHEITRPLKEGTLGNIGRGFISGLTGADIPQSQASIEKDAAAAAEKLRAQGYGQPAKEISVQDAVKRKTKYSTTTVYQRSGSTMATTGTQGRGCSRIAPTLKI